MSTETSAERRGGRSMPATYSTTPEPIGKALKRVTSSFSAAAVRSGPERAGA